MFTCKSCVSASIFLHCYLLLLQALSSARLVAAGMGSYAYSQHRTSMSTSSTYSTSSYSASTTSTVYNASSANDSTSTSKNTSNADAALSLWGSLYDDAAVCAETHHFLDRIRLKNEALSAPWEPRSAEIQDVFALYYTNGASAQVEPDEYNRFLAASRAIQDQLVFELDNNAKNVEVSAQNTTKSATAATSSKKNSSISVAENKGVSEKKVSPRGSNGNGTSKTPVLPAAPLPPAPPSSSQPTHTSPYELSGDNAAAEPQFLVQNAALVQDSLTFLGMKACPFLLAEIERKRMERFSAHEEAKRKALALAEEAKRAEFLRVEAEKEKQRQEEDRRKNWQAQRAQRKPSGIFETP